MRINAYKEKVAETAIEGSKRARLERCAGDVPIAPAASGEDERQHDEIRMRYIHVGKRLLETAHEEQPHKLSKNDNQSKNVQIKPQLQPCMCLLNKYLVSGERQDRTEPGTCEEVSRHIKEVLD